MKRIYLVRHGNVTQNGIPRYFGITDVDLNEEGLKSLDLLNFHMRDKQLDAIYSSNLIRTKYMAENISSSLKIDHKIINEFNEINFGKWEGLSFNEIKEKYPVEFSLWIKKNLDFNFPEGESLQKVRDRVLPKYNEIFFSLPSNANVLMILHSSVIKVILCEALKSPDSFWYINQDYAAINIIDYSPDNHYISLLNFTGYLENNR